MTKERMNIKVNVKRLIIENIFLFIFQSKLFVFITAINYLFLSNKNFMKTSSLDFLDTLSYYQDVQKLLSETDLKKKFVDLNESFILQ